MINIPIPANETGLPKSRRAFLSGFTTLPLIGGGVILTGQPTAAAVPITPGLLESYKSWLGQEYDALCVEMAWRTDIATPYSKKDHASRFHFIRSYRHNIGNTASFHLLGAAKPSSRAAIVMAAVDCAWRED